MGFRLCCMGFRLCSAHVTMNVPKHSAALLLLPMRHLDAHPYSRTHPLHIYPLFLATNTPVYMSPLPCAALARRFWHKGHTLCKAAAAVNNIGDVACRGWRHLYPRATLQPGKPYIVLCNSSARQPGKNLMPSSSPAAPLNSLARPCCSRCRTARTSTSRCRPSSSVPAT